MSDDIEPIDQDVNTVPVKRYAIWVGLEVVERWILHGTGASVVLDVPADLVIVDRRMIHIGEGETSRRLLELQVETSEAIAPERLNGETPDGLPLFLPRFVSAPEGSISLSELVIELASCEKACNDELKEAQRMKFRTRCERALAAREMVNYLKKRFMPRPAARSIGADGG